MDSTSGPISAWALSTASVAVRSRATGRMRESKKLCVLHAASGTAARRPSTFTVRQTGARMFRAVRVAPRRASISARRSWSSQESCATERSSSFSAATSGLP